MPTVAERRAEFRRLHEGGCFLLPNPWDIGSTRYLQSLGFKALATTSAGAAFSMGRSDGGVGLDDMLAHIRILTQASDLPINADFEHGYAKDEKALAANVRRCVETGVAGLSIEDSTGDKAKPLFEIKEAAARMRVARAAVDAASKDVLLVGRAECFLVGHPDPLKESLDRLVVYAEAGADCLYAPGLRKREDIEAAVRAVAPKPLNLLIGWAADYTLQDIAAMGVRRVSVGGALALSAWGGFVRAVKGLQEGRFDGFKDNARGADLNALFAKDREGRA